MEEIEFLFLHLTEYFGSKFDFGTLSDKFASPFVQLTYLRYEIKSNPSISSRSFFVNNPQEPVYYSRSIAKSLSITNTLTAKYLSQPPDNIQQFADDDGGYVGGIVLNGTDILVIAILADSEDTHFIFQTITREITIIIT